LAIELHFDWHHGALYVDLLAVLLAGSIGVFFLFVPILPVIGVAAVVIGLMAMFWLGFRVGQNPAAVADQHLTPAWLLAQ
jgi:hypothetical protein